VGSGSRLIVEVSARIVTVDAYLLGGQSDKRS